MASSHRHRNNPPDRRPPFRGNTFLIADPKALAHLIDRIIRRDHEGSTNGAARRLAVWIAAFGRQHGDRGFASLSQSQLHRLRHAERTTLQERNLYGLLFLIRDEDDWDALRNTIITPEKRKKIEDARRLFRHRTLATSPARYSILRLMRASFRVEFGEFDAFVRRKVHEEEAIELALDRVVEPFVRAADERNGGVDREWDELSFREQGDYVSLALRREMILLDREPDIQRVQRQKPNRYLDALAGQARRVRRVRESQGFGS